MLKHSLSVLIVVLIGFIDNSAFGIPVALSECGECSIQYPFTDPCDPQALEGCLRVVTFCDRLDSGIYLISAGTPSLVTGLEWTCRNCINCKTIPAPPNMNCAGTVYVSFTESVSTNVAASITVNYMVIQAALDASIGHVTERFKSFEFEVSPEGGVPPCWIIGYQATMTTTLNMITGMNHTWTVGGTIIDFGASCCVEETIWQDPGCGGVDESTAIGSAWVTAIAELSTWKKCLNLPGTGH